MPIDDNTRFTVAVDRATGETTPIAVDPDSGRAFAFDPETDETIPLSFDPAGSSNGDSGLLVPVGVDRTTGEVGIVGIVDRETGQVGIIGGADSGVDLGELDPATLDGLVEVAGGDGRNLGVIVQAALLMLAVIFVLRLRRWRPTTRGRHRRPARPDLPVDAHDAEAGLTASLHAVTDTGDPRERIIAAYTRLLEALDAAGAPRLAHEAPHEHLDRVLTPLGVRPEPVHRLAELFVMARFSDHPITEHHRTAAADALRLSLASLREATDLATAADSGTEQRAAAGTSKR